MVVSNTLVCLACFFTFTISLTTQCVIMDDHGRSLPSFTDYGRNVERIIRHHQAIIPSYMFTCCGNVTVWGVDVQPGGGRDTTSYSFDFQVWRPSPTVSTTGCYRLVGNNRFTSISLSDSRAIATPLSRDHVQFRPGDVLGFYVEGARDNNGGVALLTQESYTNVLVWHASIEPAAVTSHSGDCPYSIGLNRVLDTSTGAAPVMSIETETYSCPPLPTTTLPQHPTPTSNKFDSSTTSKLK